MSEACDGALMAGLPWLKVYTDLPRDHRSLVLGDMLGDPRAWTYVIQFRMYLAETAPTGRLSGPYAEVAFERCAGWTGERGRLLKAMRDAGFVRDGPARDGEGTEIEDVDWAKEQGAHIAKFERDAKKPSGNVRNVAGPARDIGGTSAGPAQTPSGESRDERVESREDLSASQRPASAGQPHNSKPFALEEQQPTKRGRKHREPTKAELLYKDLQGSRQERCEEVGEAFISDSWDFARQNERLKALCGMPPEEGERLTRAWELYLADAENRAREPPWSLAYFLNPGVRTKYETRAAREVA